MTEEDEPEVEETAKANYELNTVYAVKEDGRLGRALSRQVARMETENALQDAVEEELSEPLPPKSPMRSKISIPNTSLGRWHKPNFVLVAPTKRTKLLLPN